MNWSNAHSRSRLGSAATWSATGFAFGLLFPTTSLSWLATTGRAFDIAELHAEHPLLWVIDLAPIVLAMAGFAIGRLVERVAAAEREQRRLAAELAQTWGLEIDDRTQELQTVARNGMERAAAISHELRTPLTAVLGFADLLDASNPDEAADYIEEIQASSTFMLEMVNEFLNHSRSIAGVFDVNNVPTKPETVIAEVLRHLAPMAEQRGLRLEHLTQSSEIVADADPRRLRQVLTNLVVNAIRYTGSGCVTVASTVANGDAQITVSDTGAGMSPDELQRLFLPYERGNNESESGTGLGLGLSKDMIEAMGGSLTADSPGRGFGSTMTIRLQHVQTEATSQT